MTTYNVKRMFQNEHPSRVIKSGLTLEEAQAFCRNPEASSATATSAKAKRLTAAFGPWFCGYAEDKKSKR